MLTLGQSIVLARRTVMENLQLVKPDVVYTRTGHHRHYAKDRTEWWWRTYCGVEIADVASPLRDATCRVCIEELRRRIRKALSKNE